MFVLGTYYTIAWQGLLSTAYLFQCNTLQIIISGFRADTPLEAKATRPTRTVPFLFSRFFSYIAKRKKKKDEAGKSRVMPFSAACRPLPMFLWDESSWAAKGQVQAVFSVREVPNEAQLGMEPVLRAGRIHGLWSPLCRQGRAFGLSKFKMVTVNIFD